VNPLARGKGDYAIIYIMFESVKVTHNTSGVKDITTPPQNKNVRYEIVFPYTPTYVKGHNGITHVVNVTCTIRRLDGIPRLSDNVRM
jgi:hypothetical protein